jgi:hypothetical protein
MKIFNDIKIFPKIVKTREKTLGFLEIEDYNKNT